MLLLNYSKERRTRLMKELETIIDKLKEAMDKYPQDDEGSSEHLDPIFIGSILKTFKDNIPTVSRHLHKYIPGQEVLLITQDDYDNNKDYYRYLYINKEKIRQELEVMLSFIKNNK